MFVRRDRAAPATGSPTSVMALFASAGPGGLVVRRLLPAAVGALVVLGFLRWEGEQLGLYGSQLGVLMLTLAAVGVSAALLLHFACRLDRDEAARRDIEGKLKRSSRYFDLSRDLVCTAGFDGVFQECNVAWTETLAWRRQRTSSRAPAAPSARRSSPTPPQSSRRPQRQATSAPPTSCSTGSEAGSTRP